MVKCLKLISKRWNNNLKAGKMSIGKRAVSLIRIKTKKPVKTGETGFNRNTEFKKTREPFIFVSKQLLPKEAR
jgi:hypothetical protein